MRVFASALVCFVAFCVTGLAQKTADDAVKTVRISGRLLFPTGEPVSFTIRMARVDADGLKEEISTLNDPHTGAFAFAAKPGYTYRVFLGGGYSGYKTAPKTVNTANGADIDVGDMIFEYCSPPIQYSIPSAPDKPLLQGKLRLDQIVIEPQKEPPEFLQLLTAKTFRSRMDVELPQCWSGPSLEKRSEWEALTNVQFNQFVSIESFVGGTVKTIRVLRYDPKLTPGQIQEEVRRVWLGIFSYATSGIDWAEWNNWNIEASVEYEDGKRSSILMWMAGCTFRWKIAKGSTGSCDYTLPLVNLARSPTQALASPPTARRKKASFWARQLAKPTRKLFQAKVMPELKAPEQLIPARLTNPLQVLR